MAEIRQNLATKDWVIIAGERSLRPVQFAEERVSPNLPQHDANCPFCPGNEHLTEEESIRWPEAGPWRLRLFANKFPALNPEVACERSMEGLKRHIGGYGFHEVLVDTRRHDASPADQSPEEIALTLLAFQLRGRMLMRDPNIEYVVCYKNHGASAGTSIVHTHCQILALPMIPHDTRRRIEEARRSINETGNCAYCQMVEMELAEKTRIVCQNEHFIAIIPYAAYSPFHLWVLPRRHSASFLFITHEEVLALGGLLRVLFGKLKRGLGDPDYNFNIRSAPFRDLRSDYLHWYFSITPRVTKAAGFELGSGMSINPALPEQSARTLRETDPGEPATALPPGVLEEAMDQVLVCNTEVLADIFSGDEQPG